MSFTKCSMEENCNFTQIHNTILRDKRINSKTKGIFAIVISLSTSWDFSVNGIVSIVKEGRDSVRKAINELVEYGYCTKEEIRKDGKFKGIHYIFRHTPKTIDSGSSLPKTEITSPKSTSPINRTQNNIISNKNLINKNKEYTVSNRNDFQRDNFSNFNYKEYLDEQEKLGKLKYPRNDLPVKRYEDNGFSEHDWLIKFKVKNIKNGFVISETSNIYQQMETAFYDNKFIRDELSSFKQAYGDIQWSSVKELMSYIWRWVKQDYEEEYSDVI